MRLYKNTQTQSQQTHTRTIIHAYTVYDIRYNSSHCQFVRTLCDGFHCSLTLCTSHIYWPVRYMYFFLLSQHSNWSIEYSIFICVCLCSFRFVIAAGLAINTHNHRRQVRMKELFNINFMTRPITIHKNIGLWKIWIKSRV